MMANVTDPVKMKPKLQEAQNGANVCRKLRTEVWASPAKEGWLTVYKKAAVRPQTASYS